MRNGIFKKLLGLTSSLLILVALLNISTACAGYIHQPKVPKCLSEN